MSKNLNIFFITLFSVLILIIPNFNDAKEILIYADSISYDENENIVAKGNAKIFQQNQFILSELIIYDKLENKIILPTKFIFKDENKNYFEGENGFFLKDLEYAEFNNPKLN